MTTDKQLPEPDRLAALMIRTSKVGADNPDLPPGVVFCTALLSMDGELARALRLSPYDPIHRPDRLPAAWEFVRKAWGFK